MIQKFCVSSSLNKNMMYLILAKLYKPKMIIKFWFIHGSQNPWLYMVWLIWLYITIYKYNIIINNYYCYIIIYITINIWCPRAELCTVEILNMEWIHYKFWSYRPKCHVIRMIHMILIRIQIDVAFSYCCQGQ